MKKKVLIGVAIAGAVLCLLVVAVGAYLWSMVGKPLYEPGMVRAGQNLRAGLTPPEQSGDERFWAVEEDIQLYHFSSGEGRPVLVIHGGPGYPPAEPWRGLDLLGDEYVFHYYHQRGCGQSTRPFDTFASSNYYENMVALDQGLGLGAQIADIERIRQILGQEKLIIVGHSFGGFLASLYAAEFPERVEALVLVAPADLLVMPQERQGLFEAVRVRLPEDVWAEYDAYIADYLDFQDLFSRSEDELVALNGRFGEYYAAVVDEPTPAGERSGGWMVQAVYVSMGTQHDYREALRAVQAPVLVVHGADDLQMEEASRVYVDLFPDARFCVIEGTGHFPFHNRPEAFSAVVGEFLSEVAQ